MLRWVCNLCPDCLPIPVESGPAQKLLYDRERFLARHVIGPPQPTPVHTVAELEAKGITGMYSLKET